MSIKWWHVALFGVGGYVAYKALKGNTGLVGTTIPGTGLTTSQAAAQATTEQLMALSNAAQAKLLNAGVTQVQVTISGNQLIFMGMQTDPVTGSLVNIELFRASSVSDANNMIAKL